MSLSFLITMAMRNRDPRSVFAAGTGDSDDEEVPEFVDTVHETDIIQEIQRLQNALKEEVT